MNRSGAPSRGHKTPNNSSHGAAALPIPPITRGTAPPAVPPVKTTRGIARTVPTAGRTEVECRLFVPPQENILFMIPRNSVISESWISAIVYGDILPRIAPQINFTHEVILYLSAYYDEKGKRMQVGMIFIDGAKFKIPSAAMSLEFAWMCEVTAYVPGKQKASTKVRFTYLSNQTNGLETIMNKIKALPYCSGPSTLLLTTGYVPLNAADFYLSPRRTLEILIEKGHGCYSELHIFQVLKYIEVVLPSGKVSPQNISRSGSEFLDMMKAGGSQLLRDRIGQWQKSLSPQQQTIWRDLVDETTLRLTRLHNVFQASDRLVEQARRLIIDQIIISVCSFCGTTFSVEAYMISTKEQLELSEKIGWGYLDFKIGGFIVKAHVESELELLKLESMSLDEFEQEETELELEYNMEAKKLLDDQGLARLAAQLYDVRVETKVTSVRGLLCTGTCWRFFELRDEVISSTTKPFLSFEGELSLTIIKPETTSANKRTNCLIADSVNANQVNDIMSAMAASIAISP